MTSKAIENIHGHHAQDAYWYAECCANNGHGQVFEIGGRGERRSLRDFWLAAVGSARDAGIRLDGLSLRNGSIARRGEALRMRVKAECAKAGIVAETGTAIEQIAKDRKSTPLTVAQEYGIAHLVPNDTIAAEMACVPAYNQDHRCTRHQYADGIGALLMPDGRCDIVHAFGA